MPGTYLGIQPPAFEDVQTVVGHVILLYARVKLGRNGETGITAVFDSRDRANKY
jgi:hypothetical protein